MKRVNNPCKQKAREKRRSAAFLRKFMAVLALCMLTILAMTGCEKTSSQIEEEAMAGIRDQNLETVRKMAKDQIAPLFVQYSHEQFEMVKEQGGVVFGPLFDNDIGSRWKAFEDAHGKAVSADVDEVMRHSYEYTARIILTGEDKGQMALTITFDQSGTPYKSTLQAYSDDSKETLGSKMATAGGNTVTGLLVVFSVLILLSLIIYCFKFISREPAPPTKTAPAPAPAPAAPAAVSANVNPEEDPALIAVIAAAIAAAEDKPVEGFVVRRVKRLSSNKWR